MKNIAATVIIAIAIVLGIYIAGNAFKYKFRTTETIVVTGLAEKDISSDQVVWTGSFSRTAPDIRSAYAALKQDEAEIKRYLNTQGISDNTIVFSSVDMQRNYNETFDNNGRRMSSVFTGYTVTGRVTVDSKEIPKVEKMSREITGLLEKGIELNSSSPSYYYSKLNELKIDLLAKASADARLRAETIANNSKTDLGPIRKANMGVFQITGKNTNEDYSYGGAFNTSSKEKTASITLKVEYQVK